MEGVTCQFEGPSSQGTDACHYQFSIVICYPPTSSAPAETWVIKESSHTLESELFHAELQVFQRERG